MGQSEGNTAKASPNDMNNKEIMESDGQKYEQ